MCRRISTVLGVAAVAAAGITLAAWWGLHGQKPKAGPPTAQPPWNVVLISIDTVRTGDLQVYTTGGIQTPGLNRLAERGMTFTHAIAQAPYTLPSHASLLTGTYPMFHHVQENTLSRLGDSAVTLAEVLRRNGFRTAAFVGSIVLGRNTGLSQGFDVFDDAFSLADARGAGMSGIQRSADQVYEAFHRWHSGVHEKYFAFIHFYDAHAPYDPPAAFRTADTSAHSLYRGELQYVDSIIGRVLEELTLTNTVVIVAGDHGEMFGEHGERGHGYFVYQDAVSVPLIVAYPGQPSAGKRTTSVVSLVDVLPSLLDLLQIQVPAEVQGLSFARVLRNEANHGGLAYSESITPAQFFRAMPLHSIQDAAFKYIAGPVPELYNLQNDPGEETNLAAQDAGTAGRMKKQLEACIRKYSSVTVNGEQALPPEQREQLLALGYVSATPSGPPDPLRDAKQFIEAWSDLNRLSSESNHDHPEEALKLARRLREAGVSTPQVRIFEARALTAIGRSADAIDILTETAQSNPRDPAPFSALGEAYESEHDPARAAASYEKVADLQATPAALQNYARHMIRLKMERELLTYMQRKEAEGALNGVFDSAAGEIFLRLGQPSPAETHLRRAVTMEPTAHTYVLLATLQEQRGDLAGALATLEGGASRFSDTEFLLRLSTTCNRAGQLEKERTVLNRLIATEPDDPRAYIYLAKNFMDAGADPQQVLELAEKGLSLQPDPEFESFGNYILADTYEALGQKEQAKAYRERAQK